ncbi:hypothetical protein SAMN02787073_0228 [Chryseobacterium vrystaatense]|uniref:Uncharacterized protein n=1 Tax=Chryseobacterium vrystaatense TaxID=307480 RepID=A0A1M4T037_9FLAO|nr:hypothetical protein SAMN02787073_0228 [Chryseobacterium vrystaatense]
MRRKDILSRNKPGRTVENWSTIIDRNPSIFSSFFFNISKTDSYFFNNNIGLKYIF